MARSSLFPPSVQPGKPILGSCPDGWTTLTFGDVLRVVERPVALDDYAEYQLVTAKRSRGGVVARSRLKGRDILTKTQFMIERDDFLMSNRQIIHGGCGLVPPALTGAIVSNEYSVLKPTSRLLIEYLVYLTHSIYFQQTCFHASVGVDVEKMIFDCERWLCFKLHLPPLPEQRRIAEILSSVDEAIAATRAVIEQTRKVKQAALEALFHRGNWSDASLPPGHRLISLEEIARRGSGHTPSKKFSEYWDGEIKWISLQDTKSLDHRFVKETSARISELGIRNSSAEVHAAGTVFVSRDATVGKVGIMEVPMAVSQHFIAWTCGPLLNNIFLYYWLLNMRPIFDRIAAGSTIKTIGLSFFKELKITVPDVETQQRIVSKMMSLDDGLDASEKCFKSSISLKSALMSDLLTGRKRVSDPLTLAAE